MTNNTRHVFVVGAGVSGLSTAIRALEAGYNVTIFAEIFPGDPKSIKYASCWAGASHSTFESYGSLAHQLDRETIPIVQDLMKEDPSVPIMTGTVILHSEIEGISEQFKHQADFYSKAWWFRLFDANELPTGVVRGAEYPTLYFDVPRYLAYLLERFQSLGGMAFRTTIPSLSSLISDRSSCEPFPAGSTHSAPSSIPAAVINCTGLGALTLGDVMDTDMYPTRGETLLIRAPWVGTEGMTYSFRNSDITYVIPRQSGDVIVGGTWQENDWHPTSRPETVKAMKERVVTVFPKLLPEGKRGENPDINDLDVIEECVGLRPSRKGGLRIECTSLEIDGQVIPIIHNYGHGGAGYQESWPSANRAVDLLKAALAT
ncbi:D-amino-acid oxidase [Roridomyces roridus]|uniref:D-amino-acid oxidase n=1 Tax=Roridomyces roridus TaxID=1738132 RepID=A0AAD7C2A7_9AGAR|nr:D-amino-acid oxidase [Roridomyces roridus]